MKLRKPTAVGDPLDIPANAVRRRESIPPAWVVAWSRHGIDPIEAAWHESHSPKNMVTVLLVCDKWNARMTQLLGDDPAAYGTLPGVMWRAAEELAKRETDATAARMREADIWWKTPGGDFFTVSNRIFLETAIAERLLANKIHRTISPPSTREVMACIRARQDHK